MASTRSLADGGQFRRRRSSRSARRRARRMAGRSSSYPRRRPDLELGAEQAAGGGQPAPRAPGVAGRGRPRPWVAIGPAPCGPATTAWHGRCASPWGSPPSRRGDQVNVLRRTATGFLARRNGPPVTHGGGPSSGPRPRCHLAAARRGSASASTVPRRACGTITAPRRNGPVFLISGTVTTNAAGTTRSTAAWRSTNGGTTWSAVTVPAGDGAPPPERRRAVATAARVRGRPGPARAGRRRRLHLRRRTAWKFGATVTGRTARR